MHDRFHRPRQTPSRQGDADRPSGARSGDAGGLDHLPACSVIDVQPGPRTHASFVHSPGSGLRLAAEWVTPGSALK